MNNAFCCFVRNPKNNFFSRFPFGKNQESSEGRADNAIHFPMPENFSFENTNRSFFNGNAARSALNRRFSVMLFLFEIRQMFHT